MAGASHRAGHRTREQWRQARRGVLRSNSKLFAALVLVLLAVGFGALWIMSSLGYPAGGGFLLGVAVTSMGAALYWITDVMSGAANAKFGTLGEINTSELFRSRSMRRQGWQVVDSVPFDRLDVDHVASGPAGVLAIESKWTNHDWRIIDGTLDLSWDHLGQATRGARKIRLLLRSMDIHVDVIPVLIVWGPGSFDHGFEPQIIDGVIVVNGPTARDFTKTASSFTRSSASSEQVELITRQLLEYVDGFQPATDKVRASVR